MIISHSKEEIFENVFAGHKVYIRRNKFYLAEIDSVSQKRASLSQCMPTHIKKEEIVCSFVTGISTNSIVIY